MPLVYDRLDEVLVNTQTSGDQGDADISVFADGSYVIVWRDTSGLGGDSSASSVKGQRFAADGNKVGGEFLVNQETAGNQSGPSVTTLASGRFVVTWNDQSGVGSDTSQSGVKGQIFNADGSKLGAEFLVNTSTANFQSGAVVAALTGGGFVVSWSDLSGLGGDGNSSSIKAQIYSAAGARVGGEFLVNTTTVGGQVLPAITALSTGGFAISWNGQVGSSTNGIAMQRFDASGSKVGAELQVSATAGNLSSIATNGSGMVVAWKAPDGIKVQLLDSSGAKVGGEILASTVSSNARHDPDVASLPGGGFLVTWYETVAGGTTFDVHAQAFYANGAKAGAEFIVNSVTAAEQVLPEIAVLPSGRVAIVFTDTGGVGGDASGEAVKLQVLLPRYLGTGGNDTLTGMSTADHLEGLAGNDVLNGGAGADTMIGGTGHDTYYVDNVGDVVIEAGSAGTDTIYSSVSFGMPTHFEKLFLTGTASINGSGNSAANTIVGNSGANTIRGNGGNDTIDGGAGNDTIFGHEGNDTLNGGAGLDKFVFNTALGSGNVDNILDFYAPNDVFNLDRAIFKQAGPAGTLSAAAFHTGTAAADAADRIVYDQATGKIFYDADGTGAAAAVLFATVTAGTALTNADFVIFS